MIIDPTVLGQAVEEAPKEQPQDQAPSQGQEVTQAQEAPIQEELNVPEKFKGKPLAEVVRSYENLESEHTRQRQYVRELENNLNQMRQSAPVESEDDVFKREWEQDPQLAILNRQRRTEAKLNLELAKANTVLFYKTAKNDEINYPGFKDVEPRMIEIANSYGRFLRPEMANSPEVIDLLYKMAISERSPDSIAKAKLVGKKEAENRKRELAKASFESPTPAQSQSSDDFQELTLEQMKQKLGIAKR